MDNNIGINDPSTAQLWAVITTGKMPKENGVTGNQYRKKALKVPNLFDLVPGSVAIQVPHENIDWFPEGRMTRAMGKPVAMRTFAGECWIQMNHRRSLYMEALKKKPPLLMIHIWGTDFLQHMYAWSQETMDKLYVWCADMAKTVKVAMGDDGVLLIMSDHGMLTRKSGRVVIPGHNECTRGYHTRYSFLSSSIPLGFEKPPHIKDILPVVLDLTEMPPPSETKMLQERLKKLGYLDKHD